MPSDSIANARDAQREWLKRTESLAAETSDEIHAARGMKKGSSSSGAVSADDLRRDVRRRFSVGLPGEQLQLARKASSQTGSRAAPPAMPQIAEPHERPITIAATATSSTAPPPAPRRGLSKKSLSGKAGGQRSRWSLVANASRYKLTCGVSSNARAHRALLPTLPRDQAVPPWDPQADRVRAALRRGGRGGAADEAERHHQRPQPAG